MSGRAFAWGAAVRHTPAQAEFEQARRDALRLLKKSNPDDGFIVVAPEGPALTTVGRAAPETFAAAGFVLLAIATDPANSTSLSGADAERALAALHAAGFGLDAFQRLRGSWDPFPDAAGEGAP